MGKTLNNGNFYNGSGSLDRNGEYARVSAILDVRNKPELNAWKIALGAEEAEERSRVARENGTLVHDAIETFIKTGDEVILPGQHEVDVCGKPVVLNPSHMFNGFMNWWLKVTPSECINELPLRHKYYKYAGRTDLVCTIDNEGVKERWLIDFKTSKRFDIGMGLQLVAYKKAYERMTGETVRTGIVQVTTETKKGYRFREYDEPFSVFKAHLDIFRWLQGHKKPIVESTWDGQTLALEAALVEAITADQDWRDDIAIGGVLGK